MANDSARKEWLKYSPQLRARLIEADPTLAELEPLSAEQEAEKVEQSIREQKERSESLIQKNLEELQARYPVIEFEPIALPELILPEPQPEQELSWPANRHGLPMRSKAPPPTKITTTEVVIKLISALVLIIIAFAIGVLDVEGRHGGSRDVEVPQNRQQP